MGIVQKDAFRTTILSYIGILLGYFNKGFLFLICLSTQQIGLINLIVSVGLFFAQLASFGSVMSVLKFFPFFKDETKKHHGFFPFILIIVISGIVICTLFTLIFRTQIENLFLEKSALFIQFYLWLLPIGISYVLYLFLESYLRSFYKNIISVVAFDIVLRIIISILLLIFFFNWIDFSLFVILHSLSYLVPVLMLSWHIFKMGEFNLALTSISISKKFKGIILQYSVFNYFNSMSSVLINTLDVIMIAQMIGLKATGVYSTVVFLTSALLVPYKSIIRVSTPLISEHWKNKEIQKMQILYTKVSSVSLVIGLGSFLLIWLNIDFLFSFFKKEFQSGIWVFFFLMCGRLLDMFFGLNGIIFVTSKKYKMDLFFTIFLVLCVFILNLFLIPLWGISGAAISTSSAIILYNIGRIVYVWKMLKIHPFHINQVYIIILGILTVFLGLIFDKIFDSKFLLLIIDTALVLLVFFFPIFRFRLEPEIVDYIKNGSLYIGKKIGKRN